MRHTPNVQPPTGRQMLTLRLMIFLGVASMIIFLESILSEAVRGYGPLYWMLMFSFFFTCLQLLHEWYHYLHITVPETPPEKKVFTVDIFTTFCAGEPYEMIVETLTAIQAITYPHKTYLCDEADDPFLRNFCREIGVYHVTRTKKIDAKAGNINNALNLSSGELCVVLDPDHVPFPNFLDPIVTHFNNPEIGFVQVVQAYKNNDEGLIAKGAAQQTYQFYGPMMMTMNHYGTVLAIGANCTFRRKALESIGGHAAGLAEDMHTSMQLHARGWKSVYVPAVLARGLVPSTLSAYYKQQLKWSRGVFDLFVTAYPALYRNFTWRQKLHYATIPLHYLSGIVFLINFLIPIVALFSGVSPMHMGIHDFAATVLPLVTATLLIRHFVQWWVMEDEERGFHVVGGFLQIGTWWVFILGFVYTLLRKDVPYVPTPKDGNEDNNWPLNVPNLIILVLSLFAATYGLYTDRNPYNLIMALYAVMNSMFMAFTVAASRQQQFRTVVSRNKGLSSVMNWIKHVKGSFWIIRRKVYTGVRSTALLTAVVLFSAMVYFRETKHAVTYNSLGDNKENLFYTGAFLPDADHGASSLKPVQEFQQRNHVRFDLVSLDLPWGSEKECRLPMQTIESIYENGSVPMINWEPRQDLFEQNEAEKRGRVFSRITNGEYDAYLGQFSDEVKKLHRPVYICFAREAGNPEKQWSEKNRNTPEEFRAAWKYIHRFFSGKEIYNVIWVWNPWEAAAIDDYFPGWQYVDWIAVSHPDADLKADISVSITESYAPYHRNHVFRSGLPVMLTFSKTPDFENRKQHYFQHALADARRRFPEIKAVVFDTLLPKGNIPAFLAALQLNAEESTPIKRFSNFRKLQNKTAPELLDESLNIPEKRKTKNNPAFYLSGIKGINYNKGLDWTEDYHALTRNELESDLQEIKGLGANAIKFYGSDFYDYNMLKAAGNLQLQVHYSFWIDPEINFINDSDQLETLKKQILNAVEDLKDRPEIRSWNFGSPVFRQLETQFYKPELLYQEQAYMLWLKDVVQQIRKIDPERIITSDLYLSHKTPGLLRRVSRFIPEINSFGLQIAETNPEILARIRELQIPFFISYAEVPVIAAMQTAGTGTFVSGWQDARMANSVNFSGLKDHNGRKKRNYLQLSHIWKGTPSPRQLPEIKILKPALVTIPGYNLAYHALIFKNGRWELPEGNTGTMHFEWKLVKNNRFGMPVEINAVGEGPRLNLIVPADPAQYQLYLYTIVDSMVYGISKSTLNTPLSVNAQ
ncbi:glycosyltransferase [Dyadobacter flavalbus]|uniref:Glycosyltransferase n=1 Tax=Dyadobacter flavalbus TaxID=2579942 RepID=A0A5M8QLE2_9BACT|nr:glycosyltransferase [Dyadobacter flavalbus]KAA6437017.1 glycosyltransferase [Dyadobacter flavalbus]